MAATIMPTDAHPIRGVRVSPGLLAAVRIGVALLWIQNAGWKVPPDFAGLLHFTRFAVDAPVLAPYAWVVQTLVLPNFQLFGWLVLLVEAGLGAFLLVGLATRA